MANLRRYRGSSADNYSGSALSLYVTALTGLLPPLRGADSGRAPAAVRPLGIPHPPRRPSLAPFQAHAALCALAAGVARRPQATTYLLAPTRTVGLFNC